jgi:hypothetical protein
MEIDLYVFDTLFLLVDREVLEGKKQRSAPRAMAQAMWTVSVHGGPTMMWDVPHAKVAARWYVRAVVVGAQLYPPLRK